MHKGGGDARRCRHNTLILHHAQHHGGGGYSNNADHHRTGNLAEGERTDQHKAGKEQQGLGYLHITQADQGSGMIYHNAGILQGNQGQEETDTCGNAESQ